MWNKLGVEGRKIDCLSLIINWEGSQWFTSLSPPLFLRSNIYSIEFKLEIDYNHTHMMYKKEYFLCQLIWENTLKDLI
jgi:hypothetical protein